MGTLIFRPDSQTQNTGEGGSAVTLVNDNADGTYKQWSAQGQAIFGMPNLTVPVGSIIKSVQVKYRRQSSTGAGVLVSSRLYQYWPNGPYYVSSYLDTASGTIATFNGSIYTKTPAGKVWTQTDLNGMTVGFYANAGARLMDLWVEVVYDEAPTTTVIAPAGSYTTSVRPLLQWTFSDPEGGTQERYRAKVFSTAEYGIVAFDPETSPCTWDSKEVVSNASGVAVPVNLANGVTYRAFVKTSDAGSNGRYGAWAYSEFTVNVTIPAVPTLAVTGLVSTDVQLDVGNLTTGNGIVVERSDDGGASWKPVRGSYGWLAPSATATFTDYEAPVNVQTQYQAWQWTQDDFGNVFASQPSAVRTVLVPNNVTRLKDPFAPGSQMQLSLRDNLKVSSPRNEGIFQPLGSAVAVVLTDTTPGGAKIPLPVQFKSDAAFRQFTSMRATGHVLLLQTDGVDQWYVQLTGEPEWETQMAVTRKQRPYRKGDLTAVAVAAPVDLTPAPGTLPGSVGG